MKKKTYTPAPPVPQELRDRYQAVLEVLSGLTTVAEAARRLGMSRNHFQTLMHRGLQGLMAGLQRGKPGRPAKPESQVAVEAERDQLRRKTEQLEQRLDMQTRLMGLASELMKGSSTRTRTKKRSSTVTKADDDGEEPPSSLRDLARQLDGLELPRPAVARALGVPITTLRRWLVTTPKPRPHRSTPAPTAAIEAAIEDVRALRGLVGADALHHAHPELSRRQAAQIKTSTRTAMERERRVACAHVVVTEPGILRGFDAMDRGWGHEPRYVLIASDACVPFRTTVVSVIRYDDNSVARTLEADFERNGAPLVLRLDRAKAHSAPRTSAVLAAYGVLALQGPPRHPGFYGQLERQNREHAAWVHVADDELGEPFHAALEHMQHALNVRWRRRALDWRTPAQVWAARRPIALDRAELRAQVDAHARKLRLCAAHDKMSEDVAKRMAIELALTNLGYLRIENRRRVLGECGSPIRPF